MNSQNSPSSQGGQTIQHPPRQPVWLERWPDQSRIKRMFPEVLRTMSYSLLNRFQGLHVGWDEHALSIRFGGHLVKWILAGDGWIRQCTCGYKNDCCMHAYAAHCVLRRICRREGWPLPGGEPDGDAAPGRRNDPAGAPRPAAPRRPALRIASSPPGAGSLGAWGRPLPAEEDTLFTAAYRSLVERPGAAPGSRKLEVEVDFHHEPGKVVLRFYTRDDDQRILRNMNTLGFFISDIQQKRRGAQAWGEDDRRFLLWLHQHLRQIPYTRRNFNVYKCSPEEFERWRERWKEVPGRFLERATQAPMPAPGEAVPLRQIVRLSECPGDRVAVAALFVFPDGREMAYHEILQQYSKGGELSAALRDFSRFEPVISRPQLNKFFSRKTPTMPRDKVLEMLEELIEHHLEIVEGNCVRRAGVPVKETTFRADCQHGQFVFQMLNDGRLWPLADQAAAVRREMKLRRRKDGFEISEALPGVAALDFKDRLLAFVRVHQGMVDGCQARIGADLDSARDLKEFWATVPGGVGKEASASLQDLLEGRPVELRTELAATPVQSLVQLDLHWKLGDELVSDQEFKRILQQDSPIFHLGSHWFEFPPEEARRLREKFQSGDASPIQTLLLTPREARKRLRELTEDPSVEMELASRDFARGILASPPPELPPIPERLAGILRNYQKEGVEFLADRAQCGIGAILADDMGLGKTLQVLTLVQSWKDARGDGESGTALIVCPASVMPVWEEQARRFCPRLRVSTAAGPPERRREAISGCGGADLLITHYALVNKDLPELQKQEFEFIILDEAQSIKNPEALVSRAVKTLPGRRRLALTGTPLENKALDLWSIMDFLNPGYLGGKDSFQNCHLAPGGYQRLARRIAPMILRRTKGMVDLELPPRTVEILPVALGDEQRLLYLDILKSTRQTAAAGGSVLNLLACLTRLRQLCCDPELLLKEPCRYGSAKLEILREKLQELVQGGHSVLVFSQFAQMLGIIGRNLEADGIPFRTITGETSLDERRGLVEAFETSPAPEVFLLSLKAAGTGLTLTKADYVFLYDPWWNPAAENQAIDRTHRIGQTKPVMAYRMIARDTVEERVLELMREKQALFDAVVEGATDADTIHRLTAADLQALLR